MLTIILDAKDAFLSYNSRENRAFIPFAIKQVDMCHNLRNICKVMWASAIFYAKSMELVRVYL